MNKIIDYSVRRSNRAKYMRINISNEGNVELVLPKFCSVAQGKAFIKSKHEWISKTLNKIPKPEYSFLGKSITINYKVKQTENRVDIEFSNNHLVFSGSAENKNKIDEIYIKWLKLQAKDYIPRRTADIALKYGLCFNRVSIKNQKTKWGSCSSKKNLNFNCKLMKYSLKTIDAIIVHELCHLKELNHSPKYWEMVKSIMPDYEKAVLPLKSRNTNF